VIRDSNPNFRINPDSDPNVCLIASEMLWIHCLVGVSHFAECRENRPVTMRDANKSPKISHYAMVREVESGPESVSGTRLPPKVNQFFRLVSPIITSSFNEIGSLLLQQYCSQTDSMTDKPTESHNSALSEVTLTINSMRRVWTGRRGQVFQNPNPEP